METVWSFYELLSKFMKSTFKPSIFRLAGCPSQLILKGGKGGMAAKKKKKSDTFEIRLTAVLSSKF